MNDKPRGSRFRLSLRALMVIVLVTGGVLGWKANRAHTQRRAVEAVKAMHGHVMYDFQYTKYEGPGGVIPRRKEPAAPKWLRNLVGDEYFQEVTMVIFLREASDDTLSTLAKFDHLVQLSLIGRADASALARVARISSLQSLGLSRASVNDAGLAGLAGAKKLRRLAIRGAYGVTDAGMVSLAGLPDLKSVEIHFAPMLTANGLKNLGPRLAELETLIINMTALTDEGMACLEDCRKLKTLSLPNAKIGDAGFAHFRSMDALENLIVSSTQVTDEGLAVLGGLKNLRSLSIDNTKITDNGLASLEGLLNLESLTLQETKITDEGLDQIRKMKSLKTLVLGTQVSPQAIAALRMKRPSLKIISVPPRSRPVPPASTTPAAMK